MNGNLDADAAERLTVDFQLYARVLWRFRLLVVCGLLLATTLALLSVVRVSPDGLKYRQTELWSSTTRLIVTQQGFPWGRLLAEDPSLSAEAAAQPRDSARRPEPAQQSAVLYAELATSDPVRKLMRRDGPDRRQDLGDAGRRAATGDTRCR